VSDIFAGFGAWPPALSRCVSTAIINLLVFNLTTAVVLDGWHPKFVLHFETREKGRLLSALTLLDDSTPLRQREE
jgi:hypothetical protein